MFCLDEEVNGTFLFVGARLAREEAGIVEITFD
jgi:hypothetical protein